MRSDFGTNIREWPGIMSPHAKRRWSMFFDYSKKIMGFAAFIVVSAALVPILLTSQTQSARDYQLEDNTRQLRQLSSVPTDIAVIRTQVESLSKQVQQTQVSVESLRETGVYLILGMLGWMAKELFSFLSQKVKQKGDT